MNILKEFESKGDAQQKPYFPCHEKTCLCHYKLEYAWTTHMQSD